MDLISVPIDFASLAARLALAAVLGAVLGLNREMSSKPAGVRTHALVGLGAALLTLVGTLLTQGAAGDVTAISRVMQGLLAGIGFLGAGAIIRNSEGSGVHGLTTAATIWIVAATGAAVGAGLWRSGVTAVVLALIIVIVGGPIDGAVHRFRLRGASRKGKVEREK